MATTPMPYAPYRATAAQYDPGRASTTSDPRKIASNQLQQVQGQGTALQQNEQDLANQYAQQASGVESYLNPIESNLAQGGGGYNTAEQQQIQLDPATKAQIQLSGQDKQNIITGAGISAGANTAAGVGAAERAAAASGGNPMALATYRARAAQQQGAQAGDAMTQARIGAKQAEAQGATTAQGLQSQGAQAVGGARMGQQAQGLGYYGGLQQEKAGQSLAEQGLQNQTYGTQTSGTGQASGLGVQASQTPSTMDKVLGGVAGAATGIMSKLADGSSSEDSTGGGMDAVLGEDGPEVIVEHASDPNRSHTTFMEDGGFSPDLPMASGAYGSTATPMAPAVLSTFQRFKNALGTPGAEPAKPAAPAPEQWNTTTPYTQAGSALGQGIGSLIAAKMADGGAVSYRARPQMMADGGSADDGSLPTPKAPAFNPGKLVTSPTRVHLDPGDQVVPLTYRPKAKVRPSAALSTLAPVRMAPRMKHTFGAFRA